MVGKRSGGRGLRERWQDSNKFFSGGGLGSGWSKFQAIQATFPQLVWLDFQADE
jgi:hypothetical protein